MGSRKLYVCPKVTKMGSIIGHRIDYSGVGALRGQRHIPSKNLPKYPPPREKQVDSNFHSVLPRQGLYGGGSIAFLINIKCGHSSVSVI